MGSRLRGEHLGTVVKSVAPARPKFVKMSRCGSWGLLSQLVDRRDTERGPCDLHATAVVMHKILFDW